MVQQYEITLPQYKRGYHLITGIIQKTIEVFPQIGLAHIFIKHCSAGLTINENADPSVRRDFESIMNEIVPENQSFYTHTLEGDDDMPAHIKASLTGASVTVPITGGRLNLGTWQGIYLCEFRDHGGPRKLVLSIIS